MKDALEKLKVVGAVSNERGCCRRPKVEILAPDDKPHILLLGDATDPATIVVPVIITVCVRCGNIKHYSTSALEAASARMADLL